MYGDRDRCDDGLLVDLYKKSINSKMPFNKHFSFLKYTHSGGLKLRLSGRLSLELEEYFSEAESELS